MGPFIQDFKIPEEHLQASLFESIHATLLGLCTNRIYRKLFQLVVHLLKAFLGRCRARVGTVHRMHLHPSIFYCNREP